MYTNVSMHYCGGTNDLFISELARLSGVSERSLRHYEKKKLIVSRRLENSYRDFDASQVERVKVVQFYLGLGLTTDRIENMFTCARKQDLSQEGCMEEAALALYEHNLADLNGHIEKLLEVKSRLEERIFLLKAGKITPLQMVWDDNGSLKDLPGESQAYPSSIRDSAIDTLRLKNSQGRYHRPSGPVQTS
jgi:MerR family Zn(II)-responsive transcriptional regulator of zntA